MNWNLLNNRQAAIVRMPLSFEPNTYNKGMLKSLDRWTEPIGEPSTDTNYKKGDYQTKAKISDAINPKSYNSTYIKVSTDKGEPPLEKDSDKHGIKSLYDHLKLQESPKQPQLDDEASQKIDQYRKDVNSGLDELLDSLKNMNDDDLSDDLMIEQDEESEEQDEQDEESEEQDEQEEEKDEVKKDEIIDLKTMLRRQRPGNVGYITGRTSERISNKLALVYSNRERLLTFVWKSKYPTIVRLKNALTGDEFKNLSMTEVDRKMDQILQKGAGKMTKKKYKKRRSKVLKD
jgi:hypothetical protein